MSESASQTLDSILDRQREALFAGNRPTVESLLAGSHVADDEEAQLDLLYNEIVILEELGEPAVLQDYVSRYPHLEDALRLHFEIHQAINGPLLDATDVLDGDETWAESTADLWSPGKRVNGYEIQQQIGQGGMGIVYRAHDLRLNRDVALKVFHLNRSPTQREVLRFHAEAESLARLTHPNIVRIFEVGEFEGRPYLALELVDTETLAQRLQQTVLSPKDAATLMETLALAIHHAHEHQIIHRDLKPANILFDRDGTPKITDFGLAKNLQEDFHFRGDITRTGEPLGTPRYMAPEQAAGQHQHVGAATDVYSLGTLLYECLTGQAPFVASSVVETMQRIRTEEPISPRRLQRGIPRDLETICLHCLQKSPQRRYRSALMLANDLHRFLLHEPIQARPVSAWERIWKWCRRRPAHAALIAIAMIFCFTCLAVFTLGRQAEARRIERLKSDVVELIRDGQLLLEEGEKELAHGRFQEAWMIVQAEPSLSDHRPGVGGWLDHSRRALNKDQWKQRVPPREFDERRDLAIVESQLLLPQSSIAAAREAIRDALDLTLTHDPAWQVQRERLTLVEADLIEREGSTEQALEKLESSREFASRLFYQQKAEYLAELGRLDESEAATRKSAEFPPDQAASLFRTAMKHIRHRDFQRALPDLEELLVIEPENYMGRLFQAICFVYLDRPAEARVALTACIAQRPRIYWNYFYLGLANVKLGDRRAALSDFGRVSDLNPSKSVEQATNKHLAELRMNSSAETSSDNTIGHNEK